MSNEIQTQDIPHKDLRPIIEKLRNKIKGSKIMQDIFKEYGLKSSEIDLIPICFANIPVSARTDHGVIYLNADMINDDVFDDDHYLVHEATHYCQQTTGSKPTKGSDADDYLDNPVEVEGFQNQVEYLADTQGEPKADKYVDDLLDYHDVKNKKERERRYKELTKLVEETKED